MKIFSLLLLLLATLCCLSLAAKTLTPDEFLHDPEERQFTADEPLNVFILPHSHDDVGWIVTMEEYYTAQVQYIYDTVIESLINNPHQRFIFVEVGYLQRWWKDASEKKKAQLKSLHENKQVEFIIGGIVMPDEAAATYPAVINQLQEGHQFLSEHFGAIPRIGWQIDPFGSSQGTPILSAFDCFDALIIDRVPYWQKKNREQDKLLEFVWHGTNNLGEETDIFTHLMDQYNYCTPSTFSWDTVWNIYVPPNINQPVESYNIRLRADEIVRTFKKRSAWFRTNNLLWAFGCDFNYQNSWTMFKNMDRLMDYVNEHSSEYNVTMKYALLSDYIDALHNVNATWPTYDGDWFPYNDNNVSFWTGYYTSRNKLKGDTRRADYIQRRTDMAFAIGKALKLKQLNQSEIYQAVDHLRLQNSIAQHHDGVSGTSRPQVVDDYELRLKHATTFSDGATETLVEMTLEGPGGQPQLSTDSATLIKDLKNGLTAAVVVQNSLGWHRSDYVKLAIPVSSVNVTNAQGVSIKSQIDPPSFSTNNDGLYTLWFEVNMGPLSYETFYIAPVLSGPASSSLASVVYTVTSFPNATSTSAYLLSNGKIAVNFVGGLIDSISDENTLYNTKQSIWEYTSSTDLDQPSGAYIFRNNGSAVDLMQYSHNLTMTVVSGPLVRSAYQYWFLTINITSHLPTVDTNVSQTVRLFQSSNELVSNRVAIDYQVGPLDGNREMISRWVTEISNNQTLWQDDSGFIYLHRFFNASQTLVIPGNYYPIVMNAYIEDQKSRLSIHTSQSGGCASLQNGVLEVMVHRRTLQDDYRGVNSPLNDINRISFSHWIQIGTPSAVDQRKSQTSLSLNFPLTYLFGASSQGIQGWNSSYLTSFSAMKNPLPPNIHLLHFMVFNATSNDIIMRLQHTYQAGSTYAPYALPINIDLSTLFQPYFTVTRAVPMTLSANQDLDTCLNNRSVWNFEGKKDIHNYRKGRTPFIDDFTIVIEPSQILTFFIQLSPA